MMKKIDFQKYMHHQLTEEETRQLYEQRTRKKGEVFSPAWVCNKMNNALDADWFRGLGAEESAGQFTVELPQGWQTVETPVQFPVCGGRTPAWVQYVQSRRLEVTCGEAPFLASRYNPLLFLYEKNQCNFMDGGNMDDGTDAGSCRRRSTRP